MTEYFHFAGMILGFIIWIVGVVAAFAAISYSFKTSKRMRPDVNFWWNEPIVFFRSALLTDEGRAYRKKFFLATAIFFGSMGAMFVLILIMNAIEGPHQKSCANPKPDVLQSSADPVVTQCD